MNINITPYALIPLICAFVVPVVIRTRKDIELLLLVWSVFVIIFTLKGYWQKNHGFSTKDLYFLHVLGGARTHIIWSGIRYFSCFSDAANYGVHSAMAAVTFSISAFFIDSKWKRIYFLFIALCGIYGMGISGTRSAMGVLMGGMLMITIIAKNWKALLGGIFISIGIFVFFYYTNIGSGNQYIHKMRSYEQIITESEASNSTPIYRRNLAMAAFFLVNLCLGVIGTFWLQTRTRREEVGVMLSFGATRSDIVRLLMGEGTVLTVVASLTGFLLYLQYALKEGLAKGQNWVESTESYWVSDFTSHYLLVSLVIFLILLVVVLVGIYIPARNISRIPPTEALRDE